MQYNTALGFLFSGLGLLAYLQNQNHVALISGVLVTLLSSLTLSQYIFSFNLGIDQLFMDAYVTVKTSHLGRMAPNTALCFVLTGVVITLLSLNKNITLIEMLGLLILSFSLMALVGYIVGEENGYAWGSLTGMALHTTMGFLVLGFGILSIVSVTRSYKIASVQMWFPGILCFIILMLDMLAPTGIAMGVVYIPLVFCALFFYNEKASFIFASLAMVLIILGYFASPVGGVENQYIVANRILSILAVWVVAILIHRQKVMQQQLVRSEEALTLGWRGAGNGMWDWNILTNQVNLSDRFKELLGYKPEEMDDSFDEWLKHLHEEDRDKTLAELAQHLENKVPFNTEYRLLTKEGEWRWFLARGQALWDDQGNALRLAGSLNDITEIKKANQDREELIAALKKSNDELDNFAYVASHDLKAPLRVIENVSHWLEEDIGENLDEESKENLQLLISRVKRMDALLDDLLAYSRIGRKIDSGYTEFLSGDELIKDISLLVDKPKDFSLQASPEFLSVKFNKMPLRLILLNLVSNAIKHHDEKTGSIDISLEETDEHYLIKVADDGPGIEDTYHQKIFKMFQTLQPRDRVEGSGMGLAIVRKHIELLGGSITLEPYSGRGSVFCISLPKNQIEKIKKIQELN